MQRLTMVLKRSDGGLPSPSLVANLDFLTVSGAQAEDLPSMWAKGLCWRTCAAEAATRFFNWRRKIGANL